MDGQVKESDRTERSPLIRDDGPYTNSLWHQIAVVDDIS